jgi:protein SCO1/2
MNKRIKLLLLFFGLLTVAYIAVLSFINKGELLKKRYKTISVVEPFRFTNQEGRLITERDIAGKVVVVEYFFTTCKTVCPQMNKKMKDIYTQFRNEPDFLILSHTSDPKNDNVARLKFYADSMGADSKNWWFLTGRKDSLYYAARKSYALDDQSLVVQNPETDFIHTQLFALVNKKGELKKKVYDSDNKEEITELIADIKKALHDEL